MRQNMTSSFQVSLVKSTNQIPIRSSMHMELDYSRGSPVLSLSFSLSTSTSGFPRTVRYSESADCGRND